MLRQRRLRSQADPVWTTASASMPGHTPQARARGASVRENRWRATMLAGFSLVLRPSQCSWSSPAFQSRTCPWRWSWHSRHRRPRQDQRYRRTPPLAWPNQPKLNNHVRLRRCPRQRLSSRCRTSHPLLHSLFPPSPMSRYRLLRSRLSQCRPPRYRPANPSPSSPGPLLPWWLLLP